MITKQDLLLTTQVFIPSEAKEDYYKGAFKLRLKGEGAIKAGSIINFNGVIALKIVEVTDDAITLECGPIVDNQ